MTVYRGYCLRLSSPSLRLCVTRYLPRGLGPISESQWRAPGKVVYDQLQSHRDRHASQGRLLRGVAARCSVLCCSALQCVAVCHSVLQCVAAARMTASTCCSAWQCVVLHCAAVCCSALQCVAVRCRVLQQQRRLLRGVTARCSILQCVAAVRATANILPSLMTSCCISLCCMSLLSLFSFT